MKPGESGCHLIGGEWVEGEGEKFSSHNPATGGEVWCGKAATVSEVDAAVAAAHSAWRNWREETVDARLKVIRNFADALERNRSELAHWISLEVGKPTWEANTEVTAMVAKVEISAEAFQSRCCEESRPAGEAISWTRFRPHGVVAVFGPFNFPGHIANGHIVPALLAGNAVVFKPSEQAPAVAQKTAELWQEAGLPDGVINLVQGGASTGEALASHAGIDGLFFTGSHRTGLALHRQFGPHPAKILALEMGGNNPLIVFEPNNLAAAALLTIQSAFLTAGQRCTCARRLIIPSTKDGATFLEKLAEMARTIRVGACDEEPEPFMGPVISPAAAERVLAAQAEMLAQGGKALVEARRLREEGAFVSPGIIDVTDVPDRPDREVFGPLLQVIRVDDFSAALAEANRTRFGLAAGLVSRRRDLWELFYKEIRAGVINWNQQLTGASSRAPFGGLGQSGNHRPSGFLAADYCSAAVATMEREELSFPEKLPRGLEPQ